MSVIVGIIVTALNVGVYLYGGNWLSLVFAAFTAGFSLAWGWRDWVEL